MDLRNFDDILLTATANEQNLLDGAAVYRNSWAGCHGVLSGEASAMAKGMYPPAPRLLISEDWAIEDPAVKKELGSSSLLQ